MLDFRLQLLKDSGQIDEASFDIAKGLILFLEERTALELNEDNAAMLVTHFAIAVARARRAEFVGAMEPAMRLQISESPRYDRAVSLLLEWSASEGVPVFHENERDFLLLHLCVLLDRVEADS